MAADTTVERIAGWAAGLDPSTIPDDVLRLARAQRRSVLGAVAASGADEASRRVLGAVSAWATPGPAPVPATDVRGRVEDALYAAAALSVALDFDDYLCFAHTGHSGVLVPLLLAAEHPASGREQLAAQVIANEVGGRLGGACLVGPLNGQLWSFVHAAGAALAAGRVLGLDAVRLAHGLALALTAAPRPTVPGFMAPDSKLLTAAEPAVAGLRAARLAAAGVTGPLDVLDHPQGFFSAFAYAPLPALLDALGAGWATRTLCVKPYPGCAYLDTTLDALGEIGPVPAAEVAGVDVDAGILTVGMDAMSAGYARADPTPVTVTFSVPWNVAVHVVAGRVTADEVAGPWLRAHAGDLARLAGGVRLRHSWPLTRRNLAGMRRSSPPPRSPAGSIPAASSPGSAPPGPPTPVFAWAPGTPSSSSASSGPWATGAPEERSAPGGCGTRAPWRPSPWRSRHRSASASVTARCARPAWTSPGAPPGTPPKAPRPWQRRSSPSGGPASGASAPRPTSRERWPWTPRT